jgi:hypothetical protein
MALWQFRSHRRWPSPGHPFRLIAAVLLLR